MPNAKRHHMRHTLELLVSSLPGECASATPLAAARCGALGLLNLLHHVDPVTAGLRAKEFVQLAGSRTGLIVSAPLNSVARAALEAAEHVDLVLLQGADDSTLATVVAETRKYARRVGVVVTSRATAQAAVAAGCDLFVAKGHEAGGLVGEETSFVLVQSLLAAFDVPLYVWGGISWNTAAACAAVGCAGVLLDWQVALLRESPLGASFRRRLSMMDGSEIATLRVSATQSLRYYHQPGMTARAYLEQIANHGDQQQLAPRIDRLANEPRERDRLWLAGQDAAFAADWAREAPSLGRALKLLEQRVAAQVHAAAHAQTLRPRGPLAQSHGTEFPIVQGPMTRVSDVPEFCQAVAAEGGLPFLALALMGESQVRSLLERTQEQMGQRPWGVGMLGFVPQEIRSQQWPVIQEIRPPFAIIAGGRPDQAASLEACGIATYLHVPSPGMLDMFLREGARRFVFEGRECGGHVGPRTSFVLWELMVRVLQNAELSTAEAAKVHVLFAGGIHDRLGAAMVSVLAQPLVERGMNIGVLLGTAYLFTHEIVSSGAIVDGFQSVALATDQTVVVESGPGHAVRCAPNDFVELFEQEKRRMILDGRPAEEQRAELEHLNLGRLRIAAKGVQRGADAGALEHIHDAEQRRQGMYMIGQVASLRRQPCSLRELHEEVSLGAIELLSAAEQPEVLPAVAAPEPKPLDIAIVGLACLVPGATDPARLWHNILRRHDPITEIPRDRFEVDRWFDADRRSRDKIYSKWGGFVDDLPFDPLKYGIPPASIPSIEPMQLLAMELVDRALSDAGYAQHNPHRERTSIVLGVGGGAGELGSNYAFRAMLPRFLENPDASLWDQLPEWTEDSFAGILFNVVSGRVSNRFDFGGANCTIDAACASSLAAVYWACHELTSGHCDMVITGGCDTMQNPFGYLCFAKAGALSPRGRARVFDATSDGIVISEGHAAVVLKRREDAKRDGDKIYALIRAVSSGSDGRSKGLTAPRVEGQIRTLERAYQQAGVDPASVSLFEAHGTGTAVGDQTEGLALTTLLSQAGAPPASVAVGSIKSMIGHTKCAAGGVGLIKTVMALQHRVLPPTMHVDTPNPKAGLADGPLFVNTEARPWLASTGPRRAGVSSFGFGGTNFHVLLEEYDRSASRLPIATQRDARYELFVLRGDSPAALRTAARGLATETSALVGSGLEGALSRLAYTNHLRVQKSDKPRQAAFVASSLEQLHSSLQAFERCVDDAGALTGKLPAGVYYARQPVEAGSIAFLFPGQGSQFPGMLQELAVEYREVAQCLERVDAVLAESFSEPLSRWIMPPPAFNDQQRAAAAGQLKATRVAQPALGACGWAVHCLLQSFGIQPAMTAGHSFGELVALAAAGAMSESALFQLAAARGAAMTADDGAPRGAMLAVSAGAERIAPHLANLHDVWVANWNSPTQTVLTGTESGITAAQAYLEGTGLSARPLPVSAAFHSPLMNEPRAKFGRVLEQAPFTAPHLPVYCNVTADAYQNAPDEIRGRLAEQLTGEVRFVEQIEAMYRDGARIFVEVGPKGVLSGLVRDILRDRPHLAVATQPSADEPARQFLHALAQLIAHGVDVSLDRLYDERSIQTLSRGELAGEKPQLPAHLWLVNGAYSRKVGEPLRSTSPRARLGGSASSSAHNTTAHSALAPEPSHGSVASSNNGSPHAMPHNQRSTPQTADSAQPKGHVGSDGHAEPLPATGGGMDAHSYALFQETMRQFLATQESVLAQLFGPGRAVIPAPAPAASQHTTAIHPPAVPPAAPSATLPQATGAMGMTHAAGHAAATTPVASASPGTIVPAARATPAPSFDSLAARLAAVVADRTGYPAEMLNLDINLEGELGIDSIKRVEIIAAFRREVLPAMTEPPAEFMERLTGAKSMRSIVEVMADMAGNSTVATPPPAALAASTEALLDPDDLLATLLRVVADRTGYPAEMLDLDINLEGELGIDSIKRVEIIAAYRREVLPSLLEPPAEFMERLTAAKTMRAIIEVVSQMAGAPSAAVTPSSHTSASPAPSALDAAQLEAALVRVVADRTGYPAEMLSPEINLEGELGIDSIKRVEIIAAFRREVRPDMLEPPAELMERLTAAKTMRAILDCFVQPAAASPSLAPSATADGTTPTKASSALKAPALSPQDACPRCVAEMIETPIVHLHELSQGTVILTAGGETADRFAERMASRGLHVARLGASQLADREAAQRAVERIRRDHGPIVAAAHLLPLDECPTWPGISREQWRDRYALEVKGLLFLLQALEPELSVPQGARLRVLCATTGAGDFSQPQSPTADKTGEASRPWRGGLAGLLKVAACEWPRHSFRAIDFVAPPEIDLLERELLASGPVEIGYRDGRRLSVQTRRVELSEPAGTATLLPADGVVLVTGGAKGITARFIESLAEHLPARFVLLGRSPLPVAAEDASTASIEGDLPLRQAIIAQLRGAGGTCTPAQVESHLARIKSDREVRRNLAAISAAGAKVEYVACDVRDAHALTSVLDDLQAKHGGIQAIIHGAGIIDDRAIKDKTAESFDRVLDTKVDSLLALLEHLDAETLRLVVLFASTSGFFGNSGQCDYAAANETLNRLACRLQSTWPGKVVSLNWGPWSGAGMVTPEVAEKMRAGGVDLIPLEAGCAAACREVLSGSSEAARVILGRGPWLADEQLRAGNVDLSACGPLLRGHSIETRRGGAVLARVKLDRNSPYLQDHCIEGKAVLPVAMAVGLMAETAHLAQPKWHVAAIENVRMLSGITVEGPQREIVLTAEPLQQQDDAGQWRVSISSAEMPERILYDAHVHLCAQLPSAPTAWQGEAIDIPLAASASEAYDRWLFHGPTYQVIQGFNGADERGIDAVVRGAQAHTFDGIASPWVIDPVVVDAAPQLAMIWSRALFDVAVLPSRIASYRVYEPVGSGEVEMKLRVRPNADRQVYNADVWIVREGRVIAHMEGLEGAGSPQLNRIAASR